MKRPNFDKWSEAKKESFHSYVKRSISRVEREQTMKRKLESEVKNETNSKSFE